MTGAKIKDCVAVGCSFNQDSRCQAIAITIGEDQYPRCGTFVQEGTIYVGDFSSLVGACKISGCSFNENLSCTAENINIGFWGNHVDCKTFQPKYLLSRKTMPLPDLAGASR